MSDQLLARMLEEMQHQTTLLARVLWNLEELVKMAEQASEPEGTDSDAPSVDLSGRPVR